MAGTRRTPCAALRQSTLIVEHISTETRSGISELVNELCTNYMRNSDMVSNQKHTATDLESMSSSGLDEP